MTFSSRSIPGCVRPRDAHQEVGHLSRRRALVGHGWQVHDPGRRRNRLFRQTCDRQEHGRRVGHHAQPPQLRREAERHPRDRQIVWNSFFSLF